MPKRIILENHLDKKQLRRKYLILVKKVRNLRGQKLHRLILPAFYGFRRGKISLSEAHLKIRRDYLLKGNRAG